MASNIRVPGSIPKYPNVNVWVGPNETYTSLQSANTSEATDITGQGPFVIGIREGFTDTTQVSIDSGWITTEDDYLHIWVHPNARHKGQWDDSKYNLSLSNYFAVFRRVTGAHVNVIIDGLQLDNTRDSFASGVEGCTLQFEGTSGSVAITNCFIKHSGGATLFTGSFGGVAVNSGIQFGGNSVNSGLDQYWRAENNIIHGHVRGIFLGGFITNATASLICQHNTIVNTQAAGTNNCSAIYSSLYNTNYITHCIRNNLVYNVFQSRSFGGTFTAYASPGGDGDPEVSYDTHNLSWDNTYDWTAHNNFYEFFDDRDANFVDEENLDFRLSPGNNEHLRVGISLLNDSFSAVTTDINGVSRDDGKPGTYVGAHHPQEKGFREFPVDETSMERKYRGRR